MSTFSDHPVVVITGASSGLGRANALAFAEKGTRLVFAARRQDELEQRLRSAASSGPRRSRSID